MNLLIRDIKTVLLQSSIIVAIVKTYQIFMGLSAPGLFQLSYLSVGINLINYFLFIFVTVPAASLIVSSITKEKEFQPFLPSAIIHKIMFWSGLIWQLSNTLIVICTIFSTKFAYLTQSIIIFAVYLNLIIYSIVLVSYGFVNIVIASHACHLILCSSISFICLRKYLIVKGPSFELLSAIFLGIIAISDVFFMTYAIDYLQKRNKPKKNDS